MLIISKVFTILCLLKLSKQSSKLFFQMSASEVRGKAFLKWASIDLSSKLSLTYGGNVNYYKSVHNPVPTLPVGTGNTLAIFKTNQ